MQTTTTEGLQALRNRAIHGVLVGAWLGKPGNVAFFQGVLNGLTQIERGMAQRAAEKDRDLGGYQPVAGLQGAWATLPTGIERLTMAEVQQHLSAQGVELAADAVAHGDFDAVLQVEECMVPAINVHDEAQPPSVDLHNGSALHSLPSLEVATVAQLRLQPGAGARVRPYTFKGALGGSSLGIGGNFARLHGSRHVTWYGTERLLDQLGRVWARTYQAVIDDFGNLVEVAA